MAKIKDSMRKIIVSPTGYKAITEHKTTVKIIPYEKGIKQDDIIEFVVFNDVEYTGEKICAKVLKAEIKDIATTGEKVLRIEFVLENNELKSKEITATIIHKIEDKELEE